MAIPQIRMSMYCSASPIATSLLSASSSQQEQLGAVALVGARRVYIKNANYRCACKPTINITAAAAAAARLPEELSSPHANHKQQLPIVPISSSSSFSSLDAAAATSIPNFKARRSSILRLPTAHDLTILNMPSLHCTFPSLVHPHYHALKEQCDTWIEAVAQPPSATARRFLLDCLLPLFVCRMVPKAESNLRLVHAIKTIAWLMVADDDDDHPDMLGSDPAATAHRADLVMAILRKVSITTGSFDCSLLTHTKPGFASKSVQMLKALVELWDEIRQEMPPSLQARFISTMADYLEGIKVQASFRVEDCVPDVESYMEIRRQASFTIPIFILMEYAMGIELEEATFYNPLIQELHNVVLDYISLCNDIVSCPKEIRMGDYFNLPFILYSSGVDAQSPLKFTSFQNAVDFVARMTEDLNTRAIFLISTIHEETKLMEPYMIPPIYAYLDALSLCMSGALTWFNESARYHQPHACNEL